MAKQNQDASTDLSRAVLLPFSGFQPPPLSSETPLSQVQRIQKVIENVEHHQTLVRENSVALAEEKAANMIEKSEQDLIEMGEVDMEDNQQVVEDRRQRRREVDAQMKFMQKPTRKGATPEDYTQMVRAGMGRMIAQSSGQSRKRLASGELKISAADLDTKAKPRLPLTIRRDVFTNLQALVNDSTEQLEAYDKLSSSTLNHYKQALARRNSRPDPLPAPMADRSVFDTIKPTPQPSMENTRQPSNLQARADPSSPSPVRKGSILKNTTISPQRPKHVPIASMDSPSTPKKVRFAPESESDSIDWTTPPPRAITAVVTSASASSGSIDWTTPSPRAATAPGTSAYISPLPKEKKTLSPKPSKSPKSPQIPERWWSKENEYWYADCWIVNLQAG
ncbi:uncharacterized protein RSE6_09669 [Rhynchosporium secalis]|uniref:Uncharacterized protein n=1 Tax=Rhynchosporium secalis TaxID=38038 RepID=A0A1E1MII4_RHYSE|nr:uncharacterized protein RSE6_09669 [Rhynchosporium secalis]